MCMYILYNLLDTHISDVYISSLLFDSTLLIPDLIFLNLEDILEWLVPPFTFLQEFKKEH